MSSINLRIKEYKVPLTGIDLMDVRLIQYKSKIIGFVLNYRALIKGKWHEIYRVDTCHGYLHEQRFWISSKPIEIKGYNGAELKELFVLFRNKIKNNFKRYRRYYEENKI